MQTLASVAAADVVAEDDIICRFDGNGAGFSQLNSRAFFLSVLVLNPPANQTLTSRIHHHHHHHQ